MRKSTRTLLLFSMISLMIGTAYSKEYLIETKGGEPNIDMASISKVEKVTDNLYKVTTKEEIIISKSRGSNIVGYEENQKLTIPNDITFHYARRSSNAYLWGLYSKYGINAKKAWRYTQGSKKITIAVLDSGVDYNHPDLKQNMWINEAEKYGVSGVDDDGNGYVDDIYGYDFHNRDGSPYDDNGHGTHCAGTIGAVHNKIGVEGVMRDVRIMALKFMSWDGAGSVASAIQAIDYAIKMKANVISNSWGGTGFSKYLKQAIERANDAGIVFVAAAGNSGTNNDYRPHYPSNYNVPNVIAVASHSSNGRISDFSCYGKKTVDVSAPGHKIASTWPRNRYNTISGTSMATPHVSGVVGLMLSRRPYLAPSEIKRALIKTSRKKFRYRRLVDGGIVDAYKVVK